MKAKLFCLAVVAVVCCVLRAAGESAAVQAVFRAPVDGKVVTYDVSTFADNEETGVLGAKSYVDNYKQTIRSDKAHFAEHEAAALATVRGEEPLFATWWAILPPLIAIFLALLTKEVYSSLFFGILSGGILYAFRTDGFFAMFETTMVHVVQAGFISKIASAYNIGILIFLVLLGALVAMMNKTGASAAFGRWAQTHIKSRVGAQIATIVLGMLIFVDDYFNCLTVGSVMRPVTQAKKVSAAKLSYLIDATAAPICIIAPISSWAAAVAGFAVEAGAESGFSLFINAIPYNFYAILTIITMFFLAVTKFDFGPMRRHENAVSLGQPDASALVSATEVLTKNDRGRVIDLVIPVVVLIATCVVGMIYSGGYFDAESACTKVTYGVKQTAIPDGEAVATALAAKSISVEVSRNVDENWCTNLVVCTSDLKLPQSFADGRIEPGLTAALNEAFPEACFARLQVEEPPYRNFVVSFSKSDASVGLAFGSFLALVFAVVFYLCRRVITFRDCMDGFPEGFKAMVPAIMILCCAWTLKGMTDALGANVFIADIINGPAAGLQAFLPAIVFVIALILAFSTGTSWGTFGILIPIVLAAIPDGSMTIVAVSACMAGAVCGDHCSPISDTTIMASAGAQCNHIVHVNTQLPYALTVAAVSFVAYIVAPFVGSAWIALPLAIGLMFATLFFLRLVLRGAVSAGGAPAIFHKLSQSVNDHALSAALEKMGKTMLADGRIDMEESEALLKLLESINGQDRLRTALEEARKDGVITIEESNVLVGLIRSFTKRNA